MARRRAKEDAGSELLQEMQEFLGDEGDEFDAGAAIYWFANDYYSGQGDPLYGVMDLCGYKPGARLDSIDDESEEAQDMYKALEGEYGEGGSGGRETAAREAEAPLDIDDEEVVLKEMAKALDVDESDLKIEASHYEGWGAGTAWEVALGRNQEYHVVRDDDVAYDLAVKQLKDQAREPEEYFSSDLLEQFIDTEKLGKELRSDVESQERDSLEELVKNGDVEDFWRQAEGQSMYVPEEDDDGEQRDPTDEEVEELIGLVVEERLSDPMQYLEDIYGKKDAAKEAIRIAGIDEDGLAKYVVDNDGPGPTLSSYDGNIETTPGGFTYWRQN